MLPLSRRELRVALCPDQVAVVALAKGLRRKVLTQEILPVHSANSADWRPAIQVLGRWLTENDFGKTEISLQVSNCFTRFALMPFDEGIHSQAERLAVAGMLLEGIFGDSAKHWRLALDQARFGEPCLISAIDSALAEAIEQIAEIRESRIASIYPYAATVFNAFAKDVQGGDNLFAVVECGQAVLFDIKDRQIAKVRKLLLGSTVDGDEVIATLRREMLIGGLAGENAKIFLHMTGMQNFKLPVAAGLEVVELQFAERAKCFGAGFEMLGLEELK